MIVDLHQEGKSLRSIGQIVKRSHSTIQYVIKKYIETGSVAKTRRNRNRLLLNRRAQSFLLRQIRKDNAISGVKLQGLLQKHLNITVTAQTVRNYVRKVGFRSRIAARKPFISSINKKKRIIFAKKYANRSTEFWNRVIFSDECKFNIKISDGRVKIWREVNTRLSKRNLLPSFKHGGGSLMVWGCFGAAGVGNLHFIDGIMDSRKYINILKTNLHESAEKLGVRHNFIFQQDNDPKHTALDTRLWILYNCPKYLKTPPQSPDVNPIENLWSIFKKQLNYYDIRNIHDLKEALRIEWNKISPNLTKKLVESMPSRLKAITKSKGYPTKY